MFRSYKSKLQPGVSTIEIVLSLSLLSFIITIILTGIIGNLSQSGNYADRLGTIETTNSIQQIIREISRSDFSSITDGTYGLQLVGNQWELAPISNQPFPGYDIEIEISNKTSQDFELNVITTNLEISQPDYILNTIVRDLARTVSPPTNQWQNPAFASTSYDLPSGNQFRAIETYQEYVIARRNNRNIEVIRIDPITDAMQFTERIQADRTPEDFTVIGDTLWALNRNRTDSLESFDLTNINNVPRLSQLDVNNNLSGNYRNIDLDCPNNQICFVGSYRNNSNAAITMIDISDRNNPVQVANALLSRRVDSVVSDENGNVAAVVRDNNAELQILSYSGTTFGPVTSTFDWSNNSTIEILLDKNRDLLLRLTDANNLEIYSVADWNNISLVVNYSVTSDDVTTMSFGPSNLLFVGTQNQDSVIVLDLATPSAPSVVSIINHTQRIRDVAYDPINDRLPTLQRRGNQELVLIKDN